MLNDEKLEKLREVYKELLKITPIDGSGDYKDKRLMEQIYLYFKRIDKNPIYKNRVF